MVGLTGRKKRRKRKRSNMSPTYTSQINKKGSKDKKMNKKQQEKINKAEKKVQRAQDMMDILNTYKYKKDWKYLEKHLQQWKGEPYDFIDNYYKSPDWKYYKAANKHNKLVDTINARKFKIKEDSYVERGVGAVKEIIIFFVKMFIAIYLGCFLIWNSNHSVKSKDLDLDEEEHQFSVNKFMNLMEIYQDETPVIYEFVKSMYIGLTKIPRDALYYVFCQKNKIMESLYYGAEGGALWDGKKAYGKTPSQLRSVIQMAIAAGLPILMYFVGTIFAMLFMFGPLHLGFIKSTINLIKTGFFENENYWFMKQNFTTIFLWFTAGALAHFILIPAIIGVFFTIGYIVKMLRNVTKVNNVFKNITKSYLNLAVLMLIFGILLLQKYNLYFHEKLPINVDTKGMLIGIIAGPFILVPLYFLYNYFFGSKSGGPPAPAAPATPASTA